MPVFYQSRLMGPGTEFEAKEADAARLVDICMCVRVDAELAPEPAPEPEPAPKRRRSRASE